MNEYTIQTNSGSESSGKAFGLEAKHFMPILYALMGSLLCFFVVSMLPGMKEVAMLWKMVVGFSPLILSVVYVLTLVVGRPPHYQEDVLGTLLAGPDFNTQGTRRSKNPYLEDQ